MRPEIVTALADFFRASSVNLTRLMTALGASDEEVEAASRLACTEMTLEQAPNGQGEMQVSEVLG